MTQKEFAAIVGVDKSQACRWAKKLVPADRLVEIERLTGIKREDLRPDLFEPVNSNIPINPSEKSVNTSEVSEFHSEGDL